MRAFVPVLIALLTIACGSMLLGCGQEASQPPAMKEVAAPEQAPPVVAPAEAPVEEPALAVEEPAPAEAPAEEAVPATAEQAQPGSEAGKDR